MIFSLASLGLSACAVGYAWVINGHATKTADKAALACADARIAACDAALARTVNKQLATDIDSVDERFDAVYAELENHSKTFAKSRKGRVAKKATSEPKPASSNGVNNYMTEGGA